MNTIKLLVAASLATLAVAPSLAKAKDKRPNVLFIMTDQQRYDALGIVGEFKFLNTPNLDKLAREGAHFTNAYTPCAVSGPARSCLLTGLLVEHTGVITNELTAQDPVKNNFTTKETFDQILANNGYYTDYFGKWHAPIGWTDCYETFTYVAKNKKNPFAYTTEEKIKYGESTVVHKKQKDGSYLDHSMHRVYYMPDPIDRREIYGCDENGKLPEEMLAKRKHGQPDNHGELLMPAEASITAFQAKRTIESIKAASKSGKPFSITCSFHHPHAPILPTKPYYRMYSVEQMPVSPSIEDKMIDSPYKTQNHRHTAPEYSDPELIKYMMSNYFGLVTEIDDWVGKILETLDEVGAAENTMIVFVSDHGEMLGSHGMREKNVFFQESARVPFIINFPKKIAPQTIDAKTTTLDIFPTILSFMGVKYDERDGRDLKPYIVGRAKKEDLTVTEWLYNDTRQPTHMIVKGDWKLFMAYSKDSKVPPVLFNTKTDKYEMTNLIGKSHKERAKYIAKAEELRDDMARWLKERDSKYADYILNVKF